MPPVRGPAASSPQTPSRPASSMAASRRSSSVMSVRPSVAPTANGIRSKDDTDTPAKELPQTPARRPSSVLGRPSITPRTNKSAELRAAKKELDAAKNAPRKSVVRSVPGRAPPSSFKTPAVAS